MRKTLSELEGSYGGRAYAECIYQFGSVKEASKALGVSESTILYWSKGSSTPNCEALAKMWYYGMDIEYIFTGYPGYKQGPDYPYKSDEYTCDEY